MKKIYTWIIKCETLEERYKVEQLLNCKIALSNIVVDVIRSYPNSVEQKTERHHKLGDYFKEIKIEQDNLTSLRLIFNLKDVAGRYWKDLMAGLLVEASVSEDVLISRG